MLEAFIKVSSGNCYECFFRNLIFLPKFQEKGAFINKSFDFFFIPKAPDKWKITLVCTQFRFPPLFYLKCKRSPKSRYCEIYKIFGEFSSV